MAHWFKREVGHTIMVCEVIHTGVKLPGFVQGIQDVPPYILVTGEPLKYTGLNVVGLRRRGFTEGAINQLKEVYRLIYRSEFNISQALEQIRSAFEPLKEIQEVSETL